jgi:hypothetical protein
MQLIQMMLKIVPSYFQGQVDTDELMGIFTTQLRLLLGLLDGGDKSVEKTTFEDLEILNPSSTRLRTWEKEFLVRLFLVEGLYSSRVTLQVR